MIVSCKNQRKIKINKNDPGFESKLKNNVHNVNSIIGKFNVEQSDLSIDNNLSNTVTLLRTPDGGKCYLVGTTHFSIESQNQVSKIIEAVKPDVVTIELCRDRIDILKLDEETIFNEATNFKFDDIICIIKESGLNTALIFFISFKVIANLTKAFGVAPGGEFRRALIEIKKIPNCLLHMGDRPIKITFARAINFLTWWQKIKIAWQLLTQNININHEDIDKYKSQVLVEEMMTKLAEKYPVLEEIFVKERDIYLTHSLQLACKSKIGKYGEKIPVNVVGIVGIGHITGIIKNWGKIEDAQIPSIMSIPPSSFSSNILVLTMRTCVVGIIIRVLYKAIPLLISILLFSKSLVQS